MKIVHCNFIQFLACLTYFGMTSLVYSGNIDPQKAEADPDGKTLWYDCKDLKIEGKGWMDTESFYDRLPVSAKGKVTEVVWGLRRHSAGLCVRFTTDSTSIKVRWTLTPGAIAMPHMPATGVSGVDLYAKRKSGKWQFMGNGRPVGATNTAVINSLAGQEHLLYLPLYNGVSSLKIGLPSDRFLFQPNTTSQKKSIVFYGTSITQGGCASRPGLASTAIVGRQLDASVINLGFSGSGKMEIEMADLLGELNPSIYVLDCLWNMRGGSLVPQRVEPFVKKIREKHPSTPIVLVEDSNFMNITPGPQGGKILRAVYNKLVKEGIKGLYFMPNEDMLGDDSEGTVDGCHLNDLGMMRQSEVFVRFLKPILEESK